MITSRVISMIECPRLQKYVTSQEVKPFLVLCFIENIGGVTTRDTLLEFPVFADYWRMDSENKAKATYLHLLSPVYRDKEGNQANIELSVDDDSVNYLTVKGNYIAPKIKFEKDKGVRVLQRTKQSGVIYTIKKPLIHESWVLETAPPMAAVLTPL